MNILFYIILFMIGIVVGSFCAEEAEEIPKISDWRKTNYSNRKNEKIIYLFICTISIIILGSALKINLDGLDFSKIIIFVFAIIYLSTLTVIAGIDKNYSKISRETLAFGIISSILYMLYLCVVDLASIYLNAIYLAIYIGLLILDTIMLRKFAKDSYIVNILLLLVMTTVFTDLKILLYTILMAVIAIALYLLLSKIKNIKQKIKISEMPIGYFVAGSNIIVLLIVKIFENYCI